MLKKILFLELRSLLSRIMRWQTLQLKSFLITLASQRQLRWSRSQSVIVWSATSATVLRKIRKKPKLVESVMVLVYSRASFLRLPWTPWRLMSRITVLINSEVCLLTALLSNRMLKPRLFTRNLSVTAAILVLLSVSDICAQFAIILIFAKSVNKLRITSILFLKLENLSKLLLRLSASTDLALKSKWTLWTEITLDLQTTSLKRYWSILLVLSKRTLVINMWLLLESLLQKSGLSEMTESRPGPKPFNSSKLTVMILVLWLKKLRKQLKRIKNILGPLS